MAILAGVVVFAFLIGRVTAGGGGTASPSADTSTLQNKISTLTTQNNQLQAELSQINGTGPSTGQTGTNTVPSPSSVVTSPSPTGASSTLGPNGTTYPVKAGDTLIVIEEHFYHTFGQKYSAAIEQANGMASSVLKTGQTLTIPPLSAINSAGGTTATATTPPVTATTPAATRPTPTSTHK